MNYKGGQKAGGARLLSSRIWHETRASRLHEIGNVTMTILRSLQVVHLARHTAFNPGSKIRFSQTSCIVEGSQ